MLRYNCVYRHMNARFMAYCHQRLGAELWSRRHYVTQSRWCHILLCDIASQPPLLRISQHTVVSCVETAFHRQGRSSERFIIYIDVEGFHKLPVGQRSSERVVQFLSVFRSPSRCARQNVKRLMQQATWCRSSQNMRNWSCRRWLQVIYKVRILLPRYHGDSLYAYENSIIAASPGRFMTAPKLQPHNKFIKLLVAAQFNDHVTWPELLDNHLHFRIRLRFRNFRKA